ncbi:MAG TPA: DUF5694 domain-containing protein [Pyrinomonadaceae bacterium]|jgi:hypothetical protein|nr:DUF5694 domain-containing protein [Pyrinomonadaceae bacterium]
MKSHGRFFLLLFCFPFLSASVVTAQIGNVDQDAGTKPALVILGTYHMGTPGNNVVNPKVADITTPERQKQVVELVEKLKKFKPTKIVLECDLEDDAKTQQIYERYLSGSYQLTKNEIDQIGFRLAKESGHKKVYCVDWSDFWDDPAINYEKYAGRDAEMDSFLKGHYRKLKKEIDEKYAKLLPLSIVDQLIYVNQPSQTEIDNQRYFNLLRLGRGKEYIGANYVSWWYRRNLTILANILRLTDAPNDRILVVYGVGHAKLLNEFAEQSGFYRVESPLRYLKNRK